MRKNAPPTGETFFGGGGWIRTTEANATDLQSAPFGHSGTPPDMKLWSWWTDSNPRPADYKSAALPAELHQRIKSAVQQQVSFYQRTYTLSSPILKIEKIFLKGRKECSYTAQSQRNSLLLPLRDVQQAPPAAYCPCCGGEQYRWDRMVWREGRSICAECAAREEEEEARES